MQIPIKDEQHWHELRRNHIGGSDIAALMGCSPYATPYSLFLEKKEGIKKDVDQLLTDYGKIMEPFIADIVAAKKNWSLDNPYIYEESNDYPFLGATIDRYVKEDEKGHGILEIKTAHALNNKWQFDKAPMHVEWQVQHQLLVTGAKWAIIAVMWGGNPHDIRFMQRMPDEKAFQKIIERSEKFKKALDTNTPPDVEKSLDYECSTLDYSTCDSFFEVAPIPQTQVESLAAEFINAKEQKTKSTKQYDMAKAKIIKEMILRDDLKKTGATVANSQEYTIKVTQTPKTTRVIVTKIEPLEMPAGFVS